MGNYKQHKLIASHQKKQEEEKEGPAPLAICKREKWTEIFRNVSIKMPSVQTALFFFSFQRK